ncbi:polysaccharide deacetylase family protein [archaeon]|nr:polysaccharide deacetylase family protein [archaeon]
MLAAVNFHYIRKSFDNQYPSIFGITPEKFEKQLSIIKKVAQFVSQENIKKVIIGGGKLPKNALLITLDDGLKEQYQFAVPILKKLNIPAVFFINTKAVVEKKILNVHKIHLLRSQIAPEVIMNRLVDFVKVNGYEIDFESAKAKGINHYKYDAPNVAQLKFAFNFLLTVTQQDSFIQHLFEEKFEGEETTIASELYMSHTEIKELGQLGYIASHAHDHKPIGLLTSEEQHFQVSYSKQILETITGREIHGLSYPYGSFASCNGVGEVLKYNGYVYAFTMERALNVNLSQPFYLSRFDNNDMPLGKSYPFETNKFFKKFPFSSWFFN